MNAFMPACLARFVGDARGDAAGVVRGDAAGAFLLSPGSEPGVVRSTTPTPIDWNAVSCDPSSKCTPKCTSSRILRRAVLGGGIPDACSDADELPVSISRGVATAPSAGVANGLSAGVAGGVSNAAGCLSFAERGAASASFLGVTKARMDRWSGARALGTPRGVALADPAARPSASFAGVLVESPRSNLDTSSGSAARTSSTRTARVCGLAAKYARSFSICGRSLT
mmetsp:Transcript_7481/g.31136  ORF Transcript_7481/g.31136 Transcript_7481/m.31136 type:complete len:226 (+) Transcript_7481:2213-2890(+)